MKSYAAIALLTLALASADAQQQVQPAPATVAEAQQAQQTSQQAESAAVQVQQPQPAQPPQPQHVVLRIVGSQVRNPSGERLGLIEEVLINRANGVLEYAVVSPHYPTNSARQVPIPWGALAYAWDQSKAGGPPGANQVFIVNIDPRRLAMAPAFERGRTAAMDQTLTSAGSFFGQSTGATGTTGATVSGGAATPVIEQGVAPVSGGIIGQPVDNQVIVPGQRSTVQPGVSPSIGGGGNQAGEQPQQRVPHINDNAAGAQPGNAPAQGTGGTGSARSGTTGGSGGTGAAGATGGSSGSGGASGGGSAGR